MDESKKLKIRNHRSRSTFKDQEELLMGASNGLRTECRQTSTAGHRFFIIIAYNILIDFLRYRKFAISYV